MIRTVAIIVAALALAATAAEAAKRHKPNRAVVTAPAPGQIAPFRPAWAPPGICFTDEGYGRYLECGAGGKGG